MYTHIYIFIYIVVIYIVVVVVVVNGNNIDFSLYSLFRNTKKNYSNTNNIYGLTNRLHCHSHGY